MTEEKQTEHEQQEQNEKQEQNKFVLLFEKIARENNIIFEYHFKSNVGRAFIEERKILISKPINRDRLFVAFHEIGHIINGHIKPRYLEELKAEQYAIMKMREVNIPISRKARARAKEYISYKVRQAQRRGLKKLDSRAKRFIK